MSSVIYAFNDYKYLHLHFKDFNVFCLLHLQDFNVFCLLHFIRLQHLLSFIGLNVLVFVLLRTQRPLFLCFEIKKKNFKCLPLYKTSMSSILCFIKLQCPHVFLVSLPWFLLVARSNSKITQRKLVSLSLLPLYFQ